MAALNFPSAPSNGQIYQANGRTYRYNSTAGAWLLYEYLPRATYDAENITEVYGGNWLFNTYLTFWSVGGMTLGTSNGAKLLLNPRSVAAGEFQLEAQSSTKQSRLVGTAAGVLTWTVDGAGPYSVWHAGNDGASSGLDADLLDGYNSAEAATASTIAARDSSGGLTVERITATSAVIGNTGGVDSLAATLANNASSTVTGSGDVACGMLIIRDVNAGGIALLLCDPGIAAVVTISDASAIIGGAKWDITTSGNNVIVTNKWGASRTHKSTFISTGGSVTFA